MNTNQTSPPSPIIGHGNGWIVVNKASGISVHNAPGHDLCAVFTQVLVNDPALGSKLKFEADFGVNPVHRLDKMTSGLIILALNPDTFRYFTTLFNTRQVEKRYMAIVHGNLKPEPSETVWHTWSYPLALKAGGRKDPIGQGKKQASITHYRVVLKSPHYTLIECRLVTGRKHQIRRHAKRAGHPVIGDRRYGTLRAANYLQENEQFERLGLHASSITFTPPESPSSITLEAADLPEPMQKLINKDLGPCPSTS